MWAHYIDECPQDQEVEYPLKNQIFNTFKTNGIYNKYTNNKVRMVHCIHKRVTCYNFQKILHFFLKIVSSKQCRP